jgi:hypothetical protein
VGLGETPERRASAYRRSYRFELDPADLHEIRSAANGGFAPGNEKLNAEIAAMLGQRVEYLLRSQTAKNILEPDQRPSMLSGLTPKVLNTSEHCRQFTLR